MKKYLFLLIVIFLLSACATGDIETEDITDDKNEYIDLDGYTFKFRYTEGEHGSFKPLEGETIIGDNTLQRYKEIETNFNCIINLEPYDHTKFRSAVMTGDTYADLVYLNITNIYDLYGDKLLYCLDDIEGMDFSTNKFGYPNMIDAAAVNGHRYGFFPLYWGMPTAGFRNVLYFNNENLKTFNQPLPHELLEKEQWTWDNFEEMCKAVTTKSSNPEEDTYAVGMTTAYVFLHSAVASNGVTYVNTDENGFYKENLTDPRIIQALQWTVDLNKKGYFEDTKDWWQKSQDGFIAGRYSFLPEYAWLGLIRTEYFLTVKMEKEFGWAPFPVGPEGTFGDWGTNITWENYYMAFPSSIDTAIVIPVINYMFEPFTGETTESWKGNLLRMSFFEEDSLKYYLEMLQSAKFDYSIMLQQSSSIPLLNLYGNILKGTKTPLEALVPYKEKVQKELDKWNNLE
ncbi:MAG: transporter substrate-binding protein [Clostridia bacterium]|nr:transporter substrate-binding protein [Clostridia bacterium]